VVSRVGIVVLAAGASTRMGAPKQLLDCRGTPLLKVTLSAALASRCVRTVVVLGAHAETVRTAVPAGVPIVLNEYWSDGMQTSIAAGITQLCALEPRISAVVLASADQPFLNADVLNALVDAYEESKSRIVASAYANALGTPALFDVTLFSELVSLKNGGAQSLLGKYASAVRAVPWPEGEFDIDTPRDYERFKQRSLR
jgi:molybdenum cofactor cytidylyltransferase